METPPLEERDESSPTLLPERMRAPIFPLSDVWLLPGVVLPLHIFEPRYRRMVEDSLDGPGRIVLGTVQKGHEREMAGDPPFYSIAGLGEIGRHDRIEDGRFMIFLCGLARVKVREIDSDAPYRMVEAEPLYDTPPDAEDAPILRAELVEALESRVDEETELPREVPVGTLADWLLIRTPMPHPRFAELFAELDAGARARGVLSEHRRVLANEAEGDAGEDDGPPTDVVPDAWPPTE